MNHKTKFRKNLLQWYQKNKRDLPWRKSRDPYAVWLSEIMLQQTQVITVVPYFEKFLKKFPTLASLAKAEEEEVLSLWAGLGYYRRAKLLHQGAKTMEREFQGQIPSTPEDLQQIPGIGPYTAGAIASIAFQKPAPLVDGNVIRVYSRIFRLKGHAKAPDLQKKIWAMAEEMIDRKHPGDFNQALMELGATLCHPVLPKCERCPVQRFCMACQKDKPENYPEPPPAQKVLKLNRTVAICQRDHKILLVKRHEPRWFQGLWELPHDYIQDKREAEKALQEFLMTELGISLKNFREIPATSHSITHHRIASWAWLGKPQGRLRPKNGYYKEARYFALEELTEAALPNFDRKVLISAKIPL